METAWIVFPIFFALMWCAVAALVARAGRWTALAEEYRCAADFAGDRWRFRNGRMRFPVSDHNCLTVGADRSGLYLAVMPLFRFRHPSLPIPWEQVAITRRRSLFVEQVRLQLRRDLQIPLSIGATLAARLQIAAGGRWPVEDRD